MDPGPPEERPTGGPPAGQGRQTASLGIAFDLGLRLGISVALGLGGGLLLDNWLRTSPLFTLLGMVLGIAAAMITIWNVARTAMRR